MRTAAALAFGLVFALSATSAEAASKRPWVLLVVTSEARPLSRRLAQEVEALGLTVRIATSEAAADERFGGEPASAVIHLEASDSDGVELSIAERNHGRAVSWHVPSAPDGELGGDELLATRTVELLRARLLELAHESEDAPQASPAPRPPLAAPPLPRRARPELSAWIGPAALYSAKFRPGASLQSALVWLPWPRWGLSAHVLSPLAPLHLGSAQGSVGAYATSYRLGVVVEALEPLAPVAVRVAAGLELESLRFEGRSRPPYQDRAQSFGLWGPWVSLAPHFRITESIRVLAELSLAWPGPATTVRIAEREAAEWGAPLGSATLGLQLSVPP
ncbi:MAG TPA: hypothetical protein VHB79_02250 [Polyangiaceae bacterium]|nr:hypothetical protein [Polyangiaceae bacterium]